MGDDDVANPFSGCEGGEDRGEMLGICRTRVDHGNLALAKDVGVGSVQGHRRRVRRKHDAQARGEALRQTRHGTDLHCLVQFRRLVHVALFLPVPRR